MVLGLITGLFGGGGGGGTSYSISTTVQGGETPVGLVSTLQGGERAVEVDVGLDDVNIEVGGTDTPLHNVVDVRLPQPLRSETDLDLDTHLDVEPVQVDLCLDVGFSRLPRARIEQPWRGRFGVRVLGLELVGYEWSGRAGTVIDDLESGPHLELGDGGQHHDQQYGRHDHAHRPHPPERSRHGLHVRLG